MKYLRTIFLAIILILSFSTYGQLHIGVVASQGKNYGISNMSYDTNSYDPSTQLGTDVTTLDIEGDYLYLCGATNVYKYNWTDDDASASTYASDTYAPSNSIIGISVKPDGSKYVYMRANNDALERTMGTDYSLSSSGSQTTQDLGATFAVSRGSVVGDDGNSLYILGDTNDYVYQYDFTSSWGSVTTLTYSGNSFDIDGAISQTNLKGLEISPDGTTLIVGSPATDLIYQFTMSTAWDLSTLGYDSVTFDISGEVPIIAGIRYNNTGDKIVIACGNTDKIYQYSLNN